MQHVTAEALLQMDRDSNRCAVELADAQCDALAYACLVAIMSQGPGTHKAAEERLNNVADNCAVGRLDPVDLPAIAHGLQRSGCDAIVLSACVQMPSLAAIPEVEARLDLPVLSAATATTYDLLTALGRSTVVPDAGYLLSEDMAT